MKRDFYTLSFPTERKLTVKKEAKNKSYLLMFKMEEIKEIFREFLEEALSAEGKSRYGPAVSNYYKALTVLCSFLIINKLGKSPKNRGEIFLFLKTSFPEIYQIVDGVFSVYTLSYDHLMKKEDCTKIKNAIKKVAQLGRIETEFAETLKEI